MSIASTHSIPAEADQARVALRVALADNPDGILESLAAQHQVSLQTVIDCLPAQVRRQAPGSAFIDAFEDIASWGDVTLIVHTADAIIEFSGPLPVGKTGHGYYNLQGGGVVSGHLRADRCGAIYFVRRPFMGKETRSILFFNLEGAAMFKVYVGRDENRELRQDQLLRFDALERRLAVQEPQA